MRTYSTTGIWVVFLGRFSEVRHPPQFTIQHLKDLGFSSSNHRLFIPLLKAMGFLSADGHPTQRYHEYRDASQSKRVMAEALREAYGDLFVLRAQPSQSDRALIKGKFKSTHNVSNNLAARMAQTFFALLQLADLDAASPFATQEAAAGETGTEPPLAPERVPRAAVTNLHYNIQIHLPATKDIEVFNAIFKSLRKHLIE